MTLFKVTQPVRGKHCSRLRPPDYDVNYLLHITSNCPLSGKLPLVFLLKALLKAEKVCLIHTTPLLPDLLLQGAKGDRQTILPICLTELQCFLVTHNTSPQSCKTQKPIFWPFSFYKTLRHMQRQRNWSTEQRSFKSGIGREENGLQWRRERAKTENKSCRENWWPFLPREESDRNASYQLFPLPLPLTLCTTKMWEKTKGSEITL